MAIRTNHWLGAAGLGAVAAWTQKRQNETEKSLFGSLLSKIGITQDGVAVALIPAVVELVPDLQRMIPPEYRQAFEGAVDSGIGIAAMALAKQQGFGEIPTTMTRVRTSAPGRTLATRALAPSGAAVSSVALPAVRPFRDDLSESLTASSW